MAFFLIFAIILVTLHHNKTLTFLLLIRINMHRMRYLLVILAIMLAACENNSQKAAEDILNSASTLFESEQYDKALHAIDSLRRAHPTAIDIRKKALRLQQTIEIKKAQQELAVVDSMLQAVMHDYRYQQQKVERDKQELCATEEELTLLTKTRVRRDSLQTRFDVLCAKIRYIRKKQKDL